MPWVWLGPPATAEPAPDPPGRGSPRPTEAGSGQAEAGRGGPRVARPPTEPAVDVDSDPDFLPEPGVPLSSYAHGGIRPQPPSLQAALARLSLARAAETAAWAREAQAAQQEARARAPEEQRLARVREREEQAARKEAKAVLKRARLAEAARAPAAIPPRPADDDIDPDHDHYRAAIAAINARFATDASP